MGFAWAGGILWYDITLHEPPAWRVDVWWAKERGGELSTRVGRQLLEGDKESCQGWKKLAPYGYGVDDLIFRARRVCAPRPAVKERGWGGRGGGGGMRVGIPKFENCLDGSKRATS